MTIETSKCQYDFVERTTALIVKKALTCPVSRESFYREINCSTLWARSWQTREI